MTGLTLASAAESQLTASPALDLCSICDEGKDVEAGNLSSVKPCNHTYHTPCIEQWRAQNRNSTQTCPDCRTPIEFTERLGNIKSAVAPIARPIVTRMPVLGGCIADNIFPISDNDLVTDTSEFSDVPLIAGKVVGFVARCAVAAGGSAAATAFGSVCLRNNSNHATDPKLVALESLVGTAVTSPVFVGLRMLTETNDRKNLGIFEHGVTALNAYIGNQILGSQFIEHASVKASSAVVAEDCARRVTN